ncbi:MAG TPA: M1 family metallopeptidase [Thermoanaerobaculia bacterium]
MRIARVLPFKGIPLLSLAFATVALAEAPQPPKLRLPAGVAPVRYAAELWLDPAKETFRGSMEIRISLKGESDTLWLNGTELTIESASAVAAGGKDAIAAEGSAVGADYVRIHFQRNLPPGDYDVTLTYTGRVESKDTQGIFRQKDGADWYAFSHFEAIYARRAFPCFDEPSFKTPWQLTIHAPKGAIAVANTPVVAERSDGEGARAFVFALTKPLPSYLVAFGVGPFDVVPAGTAGRSRTAIRMIVPKGRAADARWAAESTGPILEVLENYFGIPYPYEKLDHLVIPQTVGFGAMENAGLVTYSSGLLLAKPADETIRFRRAYASVCAHETAHQWFGDYVTTAWWDDIWLNEAFATWMGSKIVDRWKPAWSWAVQRAGSRTGAMDQDSLVTARRVRQPIAGNDDIVSAFDGITYQKGAAVIAMFEGWVGEEGFRKGIQHYLKAHAWGAATADDFVAAIAEAAGNREVAPAFRSFLDQPGVPLVTAELQCAAGGAPKLALSQKRFLPTGSTGSTRETWRVPVCARTGDPGAATTCTLLTEATGSLSLPGACPARVLANAGDGYYRVLYKGSLLGKVLADGGRHLTASERISTLADVAALARSGDVPMAAALALVPAFANDPDRPVVESVQRIAAAPRDLLVTDEMRPRYRRFVSDAFGARARALGWAAKKGEDEDTQLLRASLVPFAANEGDEPALVAEAGSLAKAWLKDRKAVDALLVSEVLDVAARHGDVELFQAYLAEARKATDRRERARLLGALGLFRDPSVVPVALKLTLSTEFDARETAGILREGASNRDTRPEAWAFLKANFDSIAARLPRESPARFPMLAAGFSDAEKRADVEAFFKDKAPKFMGGPRYLAQSLEQIQLRAVLKASQQESVNEFLFHYEPRPTLDLKPQSGM